MSATARVTGHSLSTIARWLERASTAAKRFNLRMLRDFDVIELQADELCTFIGSKRSTLWLCATLEVCSRLWAGSVLGRAARIETPGRHQRRYPPGPRIPMLEQWSARTGVPMDTPVGGPDPLRDWEVFFWTPR